MATDASSSPPYEALFKCTCEGENSNCFRCHGTGWCEKPVLVRSGGVRIPSDSTPDREPKVQRPGPIQTKKEKRLAQQVQNELPKLRSLFLKQEGLSPRPYLAFLERLMDALDENMRFFLPELTKGNLGALAMKLEGVRNGPIENNRIVANAAHECLLDYEGAVKKKSQLFPKPQLPRQPPKKRRKPQGVDTGLAASERNRVAHSLGKQPALAAAQEPVLKASAAQSGGDGTTPAVAPVTPPVVPFPETEARVEFQGPRAPAAIIRPVFKKLKCPHCGAFFPSNRFKSHIKRMHQAPVSDTGTTGSKQGKAAGPKPATSNPVGKQNAMGRKKSPSAKSRSKQRQALPPTSGRRNHQPPSGLDTEFSRDRADTRRVEQAMDARRTWGGRFRDTNGTFGSHPLHDNMDDESDAG